MDFPVTNFIILSSTNRRNIFHRTHLNNLKLKTQPKWGAKNDKLNKGVCTNVQEEKEIPTLGEEKKKSNKGLFLPVSEILFLNKIFPSHNMRFNEWS